MKKKLLVLPSPFITKNLSTNGLIYCMLIALLPTAISGVVVFGWNALFLMLVSVASGYLFDLTFSYCKTQIYVLQLRKMK